MLCCALYTRVKAGGATPSQRMPSAEVLEELHFLSRLLQHEFVYGTEGLEANAADTIRAAQRDEVILVEGDLIGLSPKERESGRECRPAGNLIAPSQGSPFALPDPYHHHQSLYSRGHPLCSGARFDLFCFLLWPFIETYWLAAVSLFALTPPKPSKSVAWYAEKEFHKSAQLLGKSAHYQGDISYLEAVNQGAPRSFSHVLSQIGANSASLHPCSHPRQRLPAIHRPRRPHHPQVFAPQRQVHPHHRPPPQVAARAPHQRRDRSSWPSVGLPCASRHLPQGGQESEGQRHCQLEDVQALLGDCAACGRVE